MRRLRSRILLVVDRIVDAHKSKSAWPIMASLDDSSFRYAGQVAPGGRKQKWQPIVPGTHLTTYSYLCTRPKISRHFGPSLCDVIWWPGVRWQNGRGAREKLPHIVFFLLGLSPSNTICNTWTHLQTHTSRTHTPLVDAPLAFWVVQCETAAVSDATDGNRVYGEIIHLRLAARQFQPFRQGRTVLSESLSAFFKKRLREHRYVI